MSENCLLFKENLMKIGFIQKNYINLAVGDLTSITPK